MLTKEEKTNQIKFLELINQYTNTDRKVIKTNYCRILKEYGIRPADIIKLGYQSPNVYSWSAMTANNIPMFWQGLHLAVEFNFDVKEFLKEV